MVSVELATPYPLAQEKSSGILVVDDNTSNLLAIETALDGLGANVVRAESGTEALRHLLAHDFALVLLDVQMPSLDGFQTASLIRQRERNRDTPIIFITAYDSDDKNVLEAYAMGAVDFLFKPIVPEVLRAKASVLLALQRRTAEVAEQAALLRDQERRLHEQELDDQRRSWEQEALRRQMHEQERTTAEMARRAEELRRTVAEKERAERELMLINQRLAESDQRKDEFLAVLAHELRNPLAPIVTSLDLFELLSKSKDAGAEAKLGSARAAMRRQVQHLIRLVDDLLDVSRISSGKIELCREPIDLGLVIEQAVQTSRRLLDERQHRLELELAGSPIRLMGDVVRLTQVVANLLNNAARYTPPNGQITVKTALEGEAAVISVRDNGQGIPEDMLDTIFDTFVQFRPNGEGLGLGLTLVRRLVELHGGVVNASSFGHGQGSEFVVRLPAGVFEQPFEAGPSVEAQAPRASLLNVVVVEDNDDIRDLVTLLLSNVGHTVRAVSSGVEGAELIVSWGPDVALIDIGLSDLDGYAVARQVHQRLGGEAPYLVAMTGFGQEQDRKRALDAGFAAHLIKPATADAIIAALEKVPNRAARQHRQESTKHATRR